MSILDGAQGAGIAPSEPINAAGMALILKAAESFNLTSYKPAMAELWMESLAQESGKRGKRIPAFQTVATALRQLAMTFDGYQMRPGDLWQATWSLASERLKVATREGPAPVPMLESVAQELGWKADWNEAVKRGLDREQATAYADQRAHVTRKAITPAPMPDELKTQLEEAFKEQK